MNTKSLVRLFKALSDPHRLRILQEIAKAQRLGCASLFAFVPISQPSMSHHVKLLVDSGLVDSYKEGRHVYLSIDPGTLRELNDFLQVLKVNRLASNSEPNQS